jgi:hypothetical protein
MIPGLKKLRPIAAAPAGVAALLAFAMFGVANCAAQAPMPSFAVGLKASSLGLGIEAAAGLTDSTNIRIGFNDLNIGHNLTSDGIQYTGRARLRSVQANFDWFFLGPLHLSPGVLLYDGNQLTATAFVPGGQQFTIGGTTYTSNPSNPVNGTGSIGINKVAPMLLIGIGNMVPRSGGHISVHAEAGVAYQGQPAVALNLAGSACGTLGCDNVATDPTIQSQVRDEQSKIASKLTIYKFYPVVSVGISYRFP